MADLFCAAQFTPADKMRAVQRELGFRRRVYTRQVADKKMKQDDADWEIAVFEAIAADYELLDHAQADVVTEDAARIARVARAVQTLFPSMELPDCERFAKVALATP